MTETKNKVANEILENRPYVNLDIALKRFRQLTVFLLLCSGFFLTVSFFEENRVYGGFAMFCVFQCISTLLLSHQYIETRKARWLLFVAASLMLLFVLERYFLGPLIEPMKEHTPTILGQGPYRSPGLVKGLAVLMPTLYFWTKVLFITIWSMLCVRAIQLKGIHF